MFSSIFSKEVVENDVMKAINEETLMDIDKDYDSLKNKYKKLEEECELYKKQLEDITKENDDLTNKILELKEMEETNKDLEILKEDYEKILDKYKKDLEVSNAQIHVLRAQLLDNKTYEIKLNELKEKIEMIEKEKSFMIENMIFFKEEMAKNYNFYNEELEKTKKEYIQSKIDYSQILMEKEYISLRCKKLENSLKQCVHG
jgi:chromosome segregation ATPase